MKAQNYVKGDFGLSRRKRLTRGHHVWLGIAFFGPILLGMWATTQWFAAEFKYAPVLGPPWGAGHTYPPWRILTWISMLSDQPLTEVARARGFLGLSGVAGCFIALIALSSIMRELRNRADETHDSGRWGREDELRAQRLLVDGTPKDGLPLGAYRADPTRPLRDGIRMPVVVDDSDTPVAVVGPPGAGKNAAFGFPALLTWLGSAFVIDPKLESFLFTAGYRATKLNQRVGILDFFASERVLEDPDGTQHRVQSLRYNFLDFIRLGTDYEVRDAGNTAIYFADSSGRGLEDARTEHWVTTPAGLLAAACLHMMYRARRERWGRPATMFDIAWELSAPRDHPAVVAAVRDAVALLEATKKPVPADPLVLINPILEVIRSWSTYEHAATDAEGWELPGGGRTRTHLFVAMRAQEQLARMTTDEGSGHLSTVRKVLALFEDPHTRRVTSHSDFSLTDLQALVVESPDGPKNGLTLYIPTPLADFQRQRPLYRALICQATSRLTEQQKAKNQRRRLLYFLDEFPTLGRLDILFNLFGVGRGYGIKPVVLFQNFGQLEKEWGEAAARALIDTVETLIAMAPGPGAIATAEKLSKMTGRVTLREEHRSRSAQGGRTNVSDSQRELVRPLLTPGEVMTLPSTTHRKKRDGTDLTRPDGTVVLAAAGIQLMFRKNIPVVRLLQSPHYADRIYLRRSRMSPFIAATGSTPVRAPSQQATAPASTSDTAPTHVASATAWTRPDLTSFAPSELQSDEDTSDLSTLLIAALEAHELAVEVGTGMVGPRLITFELGAAPEAVDALAEALPTLNSAVSRTLVLHRQPTPYLAVMRSQPGNVRPTDVPGPAEKTVPIGLDTDGAAVELDLAEHTLEVRGDAARCLSAWLATLATHTTPSELTVAVHGASIDAIDAPWPHVTDHSEDVRAPFHLTIDCSTPTTATVRARTTTPPKSPPALLEFNAAHPSDAWFTAAGSPRRQIHMAMPTEQDLAVLRRHWGTHTPPALEQRSPQLDAVPAAGPEPDVNHASLYEEIADYDQVQE
jgi:type IV secretion system protein VirD4